MASYPDGPEDSRCCGWECVLRGDRVSDVRGEAFWSRGCGRVTQTPPTRCRVFRYNRSVFLSEEDGASHSPAPGSGALGFSEDWEPGRLFTCGQMPSKLRCFQQT